MIVAETELDLRRIRTVRLAMMEETSTTSEVDASQLMKIDRYERRALARRYVAIRMLVDVGDGTDAYEMAEQTQFNG